MSYKKISYYRKNSYTPLIITLLNASYEGEIFDDEETELFVIFFYEELENNI